MKKAVCSCLILAAMFLLVPEHGSAQSESEGLALLRDTRRFFPPRHEQDMVTCVDKCLEAARVLRKARSKKGKVEALNTLGVVCIHLGAPDKGMQFLDKALAFHNENVDLVERGITLLAMGGIWEQKGDHQKSKVLYEKALEAFRRARNSQFQIETLIHMGEVLENLKEPTKALECYEQAVKIAKDSTLKREEARVLTRIGDIGKFGTEDQRKRVSESYEQALKIYQDIDDKAGQARTLDRLGSLFMTGTDEDHAGQASMRYYDQSLAISKMIDDDSLQEVVLSNMVEFCRIHMWTYGKKDCTEIQRELEAVKRRQAQKRVPTDENLRQARELWQKMLEIDKIVHERWF